MTADSATFQRESCESRTLDADEHQGWAGCQEVLTCGQVGGNMLLYFWPFAPFCPSAIPHVRGFSRLAPFEIATRTNLGVKTFGRMVMQKKKNYSARCARPTTASDSSSSTSICSYTSVHNQTFIHTHANTYPYISGLQALSDK